MSIIGVMSIGILSDSDSRLILIDIALTHKLAELAGVFTGVQLRLQHPEY